MGVLDMIYLIGKLTFWACFAAALALIIKEGTI